MKPEVVDQLKRIEEEEQKVDSRKMLHRGYDKTYDLTKFKIIRAFDSAMKVVSFQSIWQRNNKTNKQN